MTLQYRKLSLYFELIYENLYVRIILSNIIKLKFGGFDIPDIDYISAKVRDLDVVQILCWSKCCEGMLCMYVWINEEIDKHW